MPYQNGEEKEDFWSVHREQCLFVARLGIIQVTTCVGCQQRWKSNPGFDADVSKSKEASRAAGIFRLRYISFDVTQRGGTSSKMMHVLFSHATSYGRHTGDDIYVATFSMAADTELPCGLRSNGRLNLTY